MELSYLLTIERTFNFFKKGYCFLLNPNGNSLTEAPLLGFKIERSLSFIYRFNNPTYSPFYFPFSE
jgi:hypothetical protein